VLRVNNSQEYIKKQTIVGKTSRKKSIAIKYSIRTKPISLVRV
jgi:hypothetical protein